MAKDMSNVGILGELNKNGGVGNFWTPSNDPMSLSDDKIGQQWRGIPLMSVQNPQSQYQDMGGGTGVPKPNLMNISTGSSGGLGSSSPMNESGGVSGNFEVQSSGSQNGSGGVQSPMVSGVKPYQLGVASPNLPATPSAPAQTSGGGGMNIGGVAGAAASIVTDLTNAQKNMNANEYAADVADYKASGKWWFDKNANYAPTFDEFAGTPPSAHDAAEKNWAPNVIGGVAQGAAMGTQINPGWGTVIGGFVGGAVGAIQTVMGMNDGETIDAKEKAKAYEQYKKQLKEWTISMNKQANSERVAEQDKAQKWAIGAAENKKTADEAAKAKKGNAATARRATLLNVLANLGAYSMKPSRW